MLSVKVVYNSYSEKLISGILKAKGNPMFEFYNEEDPKQIKKAWKYKSAAGARELPFIGVYEGNKLVKAFYAEDNSANDTSFFKWLEDYVSENAKSGNIKIAKLEGINNKNIPVGEVREGHTDAFMEGISLVIIKASGWFHTSPIVSIDWESKTFKTCNSTYSFEFNEYPKKTSEN